MRKILEILQWGLPILIIVYLFMLDFQENLFSEENLPYTISIMIATIAFLWITIALKLRKLNH